MLDNNGYDFNDYGSESMDDPMSMGMGGMMGYGLPMQGMQMPQQNNGGNGGGFFSNLSPMQMAGILAVTGVPLDRALGTVAAMQNKQQAQMMQNYRIQMMQQKFLQQQNQEQLFNQLLNGDSPSPSLSSTTMGATGATGANTLAALNATTDESSESVNPNSPNNIYTQMDDPNRVPDATMPTGGSMGAAAGSTAMSAGTGLTPEIKKQAALMWASGDKKGAIKLVQAAKAPQGINGFLKDPMMGPSRGGQGGTYKNPQTGEIISSDTNKQTSQDQATVAAIQRLEPMMSTIINNMPQFQRFDKKTQAKLQGYANQFLGTNYELPSIQAAGEASINAAPDPLLKIMGIPSTDEGLKTVRGIIEPKPGESPQYYKERAIKQLMEFRDSYAGAAKQRLAYGITVKDADNPNQGYANQGNASKANAPTQKKNIQDLSDDELRAIANGR